MGHLLVYYIFWVYYVQDLVEGPNFLAVLVAGYFVGVDFVGYFGRSNILELNRELNRYLRPQWHRW